MGVKTMASTTNRASKRWGMFRTFVVALRTATRPGSAGLGERLRAVPRLVRATLRGEYHGTTVGRLVLIAGALAYIVSPFDVFPEALFSVFGLADDAMLASWIAAALVNETEAFLNWERNAAWQQYRDQNPSGTGRDQGAGDRTVPGEVVG
jgi:uncharacterized membrane protein YkvA (DUF1232 family)